MHADEDNDTLLLRLAAQCPNIGEFRVSGSFLGDEIAGALALHSGATLTSLSLSNPSITSKAFICICGNCPNLVYFAPNMPQGASSEDCNACIGAIGIFCPNIEVLDLDQWLISELCIPYLSTMAYLRELYLKGCSSLSSVALQHLLVSLNGRLEKLSFNKCIDSELLQCIGRSCPNLTSLILSLYTLELNGDAIRAILAWLKGCPLLQSLDTGEQPGPCADMVMIGLGLYCHNIEWLNIPGISDLGLLGVLCGCPLITSLGLEEMTHSDFSQEVSPLYNPSLSAGTLADLTLESIYMTDTELCTVLQYCPNLDSFGLSCPLISDISILALAQYCPKLTSLTIYSAYEALSTVNISSLTTLRYLQLYHIRVTNYAFINIAIHCKHLEKCILPKCDPIDYEDIIDFTRRCSALTVLWLGWEENISEAKFWGLDPSYDDRRIQGYGSRGSMRWKSMYTEMIEDMVTDECPDIEFDLYVTYT